MNILHTLNEWNVILVLLSLLSIVGVAVFIERLIVLHQAKIDTHLFLTDLRRQLKGNMFTEALELCNRYPGPVTNVVKAAVERHHKDRPSQEHAMEMVGLVEIAELEKNAKVISIIAHLSPLIGLLGTVLGFIQAFGAMRLSGLMDTTATDIGTAMEYALITTAAGLAVAIPAVLAYNFIVARIEHFVLEIQTTSSEVVDLLEHGEI